MFNVVYYYVPLELASIIFLLCDASNSDHGRDKLHIVY